MADDFNREDRALYEARLGFELTLFKIRTFIPLVVFGVVFVTLWEVPYSTGTFLKIIIPVYVVTFSMIASASMRLGKLLGIGTIEVGWILALGVMTMGLFPIIYLLYVAKKERKKAKTSDKSAGEAEQEIDKGEGRH